MRIYLNHNPTKFQPIRFETTEPGAFFEDGCPITNNKNNIKMSIDLGSVPNPKMKHTPLLLLLELLFIVHVMHKTRLTAF